jgi:hypothetical protein
MFLSTKEIAFFVVIFIQILLFSIAASHNAFAHRSLLMVTSLLGTILLVIVYKFGQIPNCQKDNFDFRVSRPKLCQGGPYMLSSAPQEVQDYCNNLWSTEKGRNEYASMNCTAPGFVGRPLHFEYTPESNANWENERCIDPNDLARPHVL